MKERIDVLLVERGLVESRARAQARIMAGDVIVDDKRIDKPGEKVPREATIRLKGDEMPWVSRGGLKLDAALTWFDVDVRGRVCVDVGASTGGFTDVLLSRGAQLVHAIDVGYGQLAQKLRVDPRVHVMERTHIAKLPPHSLEPAPSVAVVDVSFISLLQVLPAVVAQCRFAGASAAAPVRAQSTSADVALTSKQADAPPREQVKSEGIDLVVLIKPQFEVGRENVGKGGIVKDEAARAAAVERVLACAVSLGFVVRGVRESPVTGADGNVEYVAAFRLEQHDDGAE